MANAFTKAQFMEPPGAATGPTPIGAVKAGDGIAIAADGTITATRGGGTINNIICTNGIQGGGDTPQVFIGLLPPTATTIGGVYTIDGSGISIDTNGLIRATLSFGIQAGPGITLTNVTPDSATISTSVAGNSSNTRGAIFVDPATNPGVQVSAAGALSLTPPIAGGLGGVKQGPGTTIDPVTGVITATGSGGTITAVGAGTGLDGGGTTGAVSLFLRPSVGTTIGGVYAGDNVSIAPDGRLNVSSGALGVLSVNATSGSAIVVDNADPTNPTIGVDVASTTQPGVTTLSNSTNSTSTLLAATPFAVKAAYDLADAALPRSGGQLTGILDFQAGQTFPGTIPSASFTQLGGILVGDTSPPGFAQLPLGSVGQVLTVNPSEPLGVEWATAGSGTVTAVTGITPVQVSNQTTTPEISVDAGSTTTAGILQLYDGTDSTSTALAATANSVKTAFDVANGALQRTGGTMTGGITFAPAQSFPGVLPLGGGTMTGAITFNAGQTFPGVIAENAISAGGAINIGGTASNPVITVDTATTAQLGVVQPDGTTITINGSGVISAAGSGSSLPLAGGTMTGAIVFAAGQTFPGTVSSSLLDVTGDMVFASAANTPASLPIGAAGTILGVNGGIPAWRTSTQLGLLTSATAATTYAPLDSPALTGPVSISTGGTAGSNALTLSGGNLVLSTSYTPPSSSSTGSVGEIAWDNTGYLYFCYAPNTWGRVQIDLTPF